MGPAARDRTPPITNIEDDQSRVLHHVKLRRGETRNWLLSERGYCDSPPLGREVGLNGATRRHAGGARPNGRSHP
jgi:hypothetical protein